MASAKVFALEVQGEETFGGPGAPAHLCRVAYQRSRVRTSQVSANLPPTGAYCERSFSGCVIDTATAFPALSIRASGI